MRYLFILLSFFLLAATTTKAQDQIISVTTQGEVELPADIIRFNINLNAEAPTPQEAYKLHKKRENVLVQLLEKHKIKEKDIRFQPVSIRKRYEDDFRSGQQRERREVYQTNQQVSLSLKDFEDYEQIQIKLIENDFDNFNGNFQSSEQEDGEDQALKRAIREAKRKAQIIAEESGLELGGIKQINYNQSQHIPVQQAELRGVTGYSDQQLMQYEQTILVQVTVNIEFNISG